MYLNLLVCKRLHSLRHPLHRDLLHKATDKDLCRALERLTDGFLSEATMPKNPIDDLRTLVTKDSNRGEFDDLIGDD